LHINRTASRLIAARGIHSINENFLSQTLTKIFHCAIFSASLAAMNISADSFEEKISTMKNQFDILPGTFAPALLWEYPQSGAPVPQGNSELFIGRSQRELRSRVLPM
jgi:hypothetical protein